LALRFDRIKPLFGEDFIKLQEARVLILGVGGVGGYALDCLYRSGVENITIVDYDTFQESNRNRQIGSDVGVGKSKVLTLKNIYKNIRALEQKIDTEWVEKFNFEEFDVIIDATDDVEVKTALAKRCYRKLIMSLGAGKRLDSSKIEVSTIWKTHTDALAKKIRVKLRKVGFGRSFKVIFSTEIPKVKELGSFVGVTGSFGLFCCSEAIKMIISKENR
jgi:tRNA A37 threonylcarbamoyladenosine dehydratase